MAAWITHFYDIIRIIKVIFSSFVILLETHYVCGLGLTLLSLCRACLPISILHYREKLHVVCVFKVSGFDHRDVVHIYIVSATKKLK